MNGHKFSSHDYVSSGLTPHLREMFWDDDFIIGHRDIDIHNELVFASYDDFRICARDINYNTHISKSITYLADAFNNCFALEETIALDCGFMLPKYHIDQHRQIVDNLYNVYKLPISRNDIILEIEHIFLNWVLTHLTVVDRKHMKIYLVKDKHKL